MKSFSENITAGQPLIMALTGRVLYIQRSQRGPVLDVEFIRQGGTGQKIERVGKGFKAAPVNGFEGIKISAAVSGTVDFVVTDGDIQIQFDEDETVIGNDDGQAIPIRTVAGKPLEVLFAGTVAPVLGELTNTDASAVPVRQKAGAVFTVQAEKLAALVDHNPAVIGVGAAQLLISDATLKRLIVKNASAAARVAIGGAAVTLASAAIILEPGDAWNESDAAGAAWYAVSDVAGADVRVLGVK